MTVSAVSAESTAAAASSAVSKKNLVDYDSFLKLLVAQAKNQDPTNPQDSTQYLAQLASFSAVEQSVQTNAKLDALLASSRISDADALVGRVVANADGTVSGVVGAVTLSGSALVASLLDGRTLAIDDGVTIGPAA